MNKITWFRWHFSGHYLFHIGAVLLISQIALAQSGSYPLTEESPTPSVNPSPTPSADPSPSPTAEPSPTPSADPSPNPSAAPSPSPSADPSPSPTADPSPSPSADPSPSPSADPSPTPTADPSPSPSADPSPIPTSEPEVQCCMCLTWAGRAEFTNHCHTKWIAGSDCDKKAIFAGIDKSKTPPGSLPPAAFDWIEKNRCNHTRAIFHTHGQPSHCPRYFENVRACWSIMKRNNCTGRVQMISAACSVFGDLDEVKKQTMELANECEDGNSCYVVAHATDGLLSRDSSDKFTEENPDGRCSVPFITSWISKKEGENCKASLVFPECSEILGADCVSTSDTIKCVKSDGSTQIAGCALHLGSGYFYPRDVPCAAVAGKECSRGGLRVRCLQEPTFGVARCVHYQNQPAGKWVIENR